MAKDRKLSLPETNGKRKQRDDEEEEEDFDASSKRDHGRKSKKAEIEESDHSSDYEGDKNLSRSKKKKKKISNSKRRSSRRRYSDEDSSSSYSSESDESASDSKSDGSDYSSEDSKSEDERRRRKRKERERRRRKEREYEKERRRRRREKEKKRRKRDKEGKDKKKKKESMKGAVTNSWGKYGIIKETDMWNKRPEFTAWLLEIKQVNLETLPNWEEKQMFKEFMEDHNTATFPSKKYYGLDAYHKREMEKEMKKGFKRIVESERTVFNDEEQRRHELMLAREKQKEEQVETLKHSMQTGMAQAMKEQAQLREEMAYQYKLGNFEAAAAIQRRLDPDVAM